MANAFASSYYVKNERSRREVAISADTTCEGDAVVWVSDTAGADITLAKWDNGRYGEYMDVLNPLIVVKCTSDSSSTNTLVKSEDGTTIWTFSGDHSSTPAYAAFRLVTGSYNTASWRVA